MPRIRSRPTSFSGCASRWRRLRAAMSPRDRLAVLEFGRSTRLLAPLGDPRLVRVDPSRTGADPGGTDIAGGLTAALSLLPPQDEKRIVLLTDGNETDGSASGRIAGAGRAGRAAVRRGAAAIVGGPGRDRRLSGAHSGARPRQFRAQTRHPERSPRAGRGARAADQQRRGTGPSFGRAPAGAQPFRPALPVGSLRRLPAQRADRRRLTAGRRQPRRGDRGLRHRPAARAGGLDQSAR